MPRHLTRRETLLAMGATAVAGCSAPLRSDPEGSPTPTQTADVSTPGATGAGEWTPPTDAPSRSVTPNALVENLEVPWDIAAAPDGDLFVTERVGRVTRFSAGDLESVFAPADAIDAGSVEPGNTDRPWWVTGGEGGTLGIAVHSSYPDPRALFVYYTTEEDGERVNRVSRFDLDAEDTAASEMVVIDGIPGYRVHNGGRLTVGPDGALWVTTGSAAFDDEEASALAADPGSLAGKVLRVTPGGDPAPGNPDLGDGADPRVFTYGHRNPQGIVWLPDGTAVVDEHGPTGYDEVNRLVAGHEYGWPDEEVRTNPERYATTEGLHPPLATSGGSTWAPSGSLFYDGDAVPSWQYRMLIGGLLSQQLLVVTLTPPGADPPPEEWGTRIDDDWTDPAFTATVHPVLGDELGRIRHVEAGPDGELYAITSNRDGRANEPFPRERDDVLVTLTARS
jgi:glucose/arabinose dehydrogenase